MIEIILRFPSNVITNCCFRNTISAGFWQWVLESLLLAEIRTKLTYVLRQKKHPQSFKVNFQTCFCSKCVTTNLLFHKTQNRLTTPPPSIPGSPPPANKEQKLHNQYISQGKNQLFCLSKQKILFVKKVK